MNRTRFNNFFSVERWDPEAALRQKAQEVLRTLRPGKGDTLYLILDDSKKAKRGKVMDAIAKMKDPTTEAYIRGHQYVCAILVYRDYVIPFGIRLYVRPAHCPALGLPFRKTTELAAQLIQEFKVPTGVKVAVLFDAYYLCPTVVKACREQGFHFASTLKSNRSLFKGAESSKPVAMGGTCFGGAAPIPSTSRSPMGRSAIASWMLAGCRSASSGHCLWSSRAKAQPTRSSGW